MTIRKHIACLLAAGLMPWTVAAQGLYNDTFVEINGVEVYVDGALVSTGTIDNDGTLVLTGDWQDAGTYRGKGTVSLEGSSAQTISRHSGQKIARLVVDGPGEKLLEGSIQVTTELDLRNGIVHVGSGATLKLRENAVVSGGSDKSFIEGALTAEGEGNRFFPLGKSGIYAPVELLDVKGENPEYSMEVFENAPAVAVDALVARTERYWYRTDISGKFKGSGLAIWCGPDVNTQPESLLILTGMDWDSEFSIPGESELASNPCRVIMRTRVHDRIAMLGEVSKTWRQADYYLPNALSPNALLEENRAVRIFGRRLIADDFHFLVFDRRGQVVYETSSLENMKSDGWDGRSSDGKALAAGAYPYRVKGIDKHGIKFENKGLITVFY